MRREKMMKLKIIMEPSADGGYSVSEIVEISL